MSLKFIFPIGSVLFIGALTAFSSDTTITEDKTASGGDWEVTVESGDTCFVTAAQTGTGAIVKKGAGSLVLAGDNTFSGGVVVDEGTVEPHHSNAFGTGKITLNADGEKECRVAFTKGELTFTNDLELVGTSAIDKPAFYFHSATNVWNGKITAPTGDFYMCDNGDWCYISTGGKYENGVFSDGSWSTKVSKIVFMTFNGDIDVHGIVYIVPDGKMIFNGAIACDTLDTCYRKGLFTLHTAADSSFFAVIEFNGINHVRQFNQAYGQRQFVDGTVKISGKPWTDGNGLTMESGAGKIVLDVEGNWFGNCNVGYGLDLKAGGGTIEFKRSYCFVDGHQMAVRNNSKCVVEFNCTTQRVAQLGAASSHKESVIHGDYGSMLEIMGGCRKETMTEGFAGMACSMQITGGLGIHMMGTGKGNKSGTVKDGANDMYLLQGSRDFQSCGNLEVSGGQLSLTLGNTWKNGTNFIMRGTGQLRLAGTEQLSRDIARLHFSDEGNLYLGGKQHVASAEILVNDEWVEVPKGWYSATQPGILAGRISGNGSLRVGTKGITLYLK